MAPVAPGGAWDSTSRAVQHVLQNENIAAQPVDVHNRPGAGGTLGLAELVSQARGDGHTVMTMGLALLGAILTNPSPVSLDTVTPLARLTTDYPVIAVGAASPYRTFQDLMRAFTTDAESITWGGGAAGGPDHILVGLIARAARVSPRAIDYVAFSGSSELRPRVMGNTMSAGVGSFAELTGDAAAGQVRILAVSGPVRLSNSNAPTLREAGVDVELTYWRGVVGPPGMPDHERQAWITMLTRMHASSAWRDTLQKQAWEDAFLVGDAFAAFLEQEVQGVGHVLRDVGLVAAKAG